MKHNPTWKNHYIPCFWSAFWNTEYLTNFRNGLNNKKKARDIQLITYNKNAKNEKKLNSENTYKTKTENLFFENQVNLVRVQNETEFNYLKKVFPYIQTNFEAFNNEELFIFDYEDKFTQLENICKETLFKVIKRKKIQDREDKTYLSLFIYIQVIRNPKYFSSFEELFKINGVSKLFLFTEMENALLDSSLNYFINYEWNIYVLSDYPFPITDFPYIATQSSICICLAPDILLEINMNKNKDFINNYMIINEIKRKDTINFLRNSSKENIVFSKKEYFDI